MCGSMVDIQSPTAEIRRGQTERRKKIEITGQKYKSEVNNSGKHYHLLFTSDVIGCLPKCSKPPITLSKPAMYTVSL